MAKMIFIHGTGVRGDSYRKSYELISAKIQELGCEPAECLWGDQCGSKFAGIALPSFVQERDRQEIAIWRMLLQDSFAELRFLQTAPDALGLVSHGELLWERLLTLKPSDKSQDHLRILGLHSFWRGSFDRLTADHQRQWERLVKRAAVNDGKFELALSRCLVAQLVSESYDLSLPIPTGSERDLLVDSIVDDLGGSARGLAGDVLRLAIGLFAPVSTPIMRHTRDSWHLGISPAIGDILMYQARGQKIRNYIKSCIESLREHDIILLAHSLGGIAAIDLLLMNNLPQVRAIVTVGSQAPYLYEIDGLTGLEIGSRWPDYFSRPWLNIYDPNDFLSYPGGGTFPGRVQDFCSPSHQPFPESHSAYWRNQSVWSAIKAFLVEQDIQPC
jgi:hypothetical protein